MTRKVRGRAATHMSRLLILAALLPTAAPALEPADCVSTAIGWSGMDPSHVTDDAPEDLGDTWVEQRSRLDVMRAEATDSTSVVVLEHCASGRWVRAVERREDGLGTDTAPVAPSDVMRAALASPQAFDLQGVVALMRANGIEANLDAFAEETCGCAAFYPELRGDRVSYRG